MRLLHTRPAGLASRFRGDVLTDVLNLVFTPIKNYVRLGLRIESDLYLSGAFGGIRTPNLLIRSSLRRDIRWCPRESPSDR